MVDAVASDPMSVQGLRRTAGAVRAIAFYLPQFHPIPENDAWWGKGFTEWTNTAKAKPMFPGHYQPHVPADLGFYDLRVGETRVQQAQLARSYGIEAFCYYHYWFAGRRLLERPFQEVLASRSPDFPFCLCWANETWSGIWHGAPRHILVEQTYPGESDHQAHFNALLPAFEDRRYLRVDGMPVFVIHKPLDVPDTANALKFWRHLADAAGLPGLYIIGSSTDPHWDPGPAGYDAVLSTPGFRTRRWATWRQPAAYVRQKYRLVRKRPTVQKFSDFVKLYAPQTVHAYADHPAVVHAWDNTPRSGAAGVVLQRSTPALYKSLLAKAAATQAHKAPQHRLVFLKSWNEWAEGNHLEPDLRYGHRYLEALAEVLAGTAAVSPQAEAARDGPSGV